VTKILIIRFSSIGDIVLTTAVVRCLKQQLYGQCEIHFLTKRTFSAIIKANPYIFKIHTIEDKVSEVIDDLKKEDFHYVIDLHNNIRSHVVRGKLSTLSFAVNKINIQKWVMVNFKINRLPKMHIVDRYMETVQSFGIVNDGKGLDYFIPKEDEVDFSLIPQSHQKAFIVFAIGGRYFTKKLPTEKIISICKKIKKPIFLLGGEEDKAIGEKIKKDVSEKVYNACGLFNINQSASIVKRAEKVITHDTGIMHIAAAFQKPVISIWGNTIPEFGMYPYFGNDEKGTIVQTENLKCRPCSKLGHSKCPKGHFNCMNLIDEDVVVKAVNG